MTNEEMAELVLGKPIYNTCHVCNGSGQGEMGMAIVEGLTEDGALIQEETPVLTQCDFCGGRGRILNGRYLNAILTAGLDIPRNDRPIVYEPMVVGQRVRRILSVILLSPRGESKPNGCIVKTDGTAIGPFPRNRQE